MPDGPLDAGDVASWLDDLRAALRGERASGVPCGACTACCTSGQFVHVGPDEGDALAHIPRAVLFAAPGLPRGHLLMGYDERGHCPMLVDGGCSIYEHRPRACRTYDCRVFAAAGTAPAGKPQIAARVARWRFSTADEAARVRLDAVRAAARFLERHAAELGAEQVPADDTQRAVLAVVIHDCFVAVGPDGRALVADEPDVAWIRDEIVRRRAPNGDG